MNRLIVVLVFVLSSSFVAASDWPQWRGPERTNVSKETGLLDEWPKEGPPLLWKSEEVGAGVPSVAVAVGKVYVLGYKDNQEFLTAIDEKTGKLLWSEPIGPVVNEMAGMRWLSQRTPTVDGERVYCFTAKGELICASTTNGKTLWKKDYVKDFSGKPGSWGYCDFPLVDGNNLICTPGVKENAIVALDKKTGEVVWRCNIRSSTRGTFGGIVAAEIAGVRQYVHQLESSLVSVSAKDGKLLWEYASFGSTMGNVHTALIDGDEVFASCGWGVGGALLKITKDGDAFTVKELHRNKDLRFDQWIGSAVRLGEVVHAANGIPIDWKSCSIMETPGNVVPTSRVCMTAVDGKLIHRTGNGVTTLTEFKPSTGYVRRGEFKIAPVAKEPTWTFPVVANGRLYLRDQHVLACYDLRKPDREPKGKPAVIFVPTPDDVVDEMLKLAKVAKDDVLVDLGCGDGRIMVAAAKKHGCKAAGYDLDPECVALSKTTVAKAGMEKLVSVHKGDMLEVDLTPYSVVTLYVGVTLNDKLVPQLEKMKPGSRIVSHAFAIPGVKPDKVLKFTSTDDDVERPLYLYTAPLKRE